jgi:hypothetical protein
MYILVREDEHYEFVPGLEHEHQWHVHIMFGKYKDVVMSFSHIQLNGKTGEMHFDMDFFYKPDNLKDLTLYDDELQLICSSIMQDILMKSIVEKTGRFIDNESGEIIGY